MRVDKNDCLPVLPTIPQTKGVKTQWELLLLTQNYEAQQFSAVSLFAVDLRKQSWHCLYTNHSLTDWIPRAKLENTPILRHLCEQKHTNCLNVRRLRKKQAVRDIFSVKNHLFLVFLCLQLYIIDNEISLQLHFRQHLLNFSTTSSNKRSAWNVCWRWLTDQSSQRAVRDGWRELDNDQVLLLAELLDLHALLRHHVQLLQGVGLLRVPDRSDHIWHRTGDTELVKAFSNTTTDPTQQRLHHHQTTTEKEEFFLLCDSGSLVITWTQTQSDYTHKTLMVTDPNRTQLFAGFI